VEVEPDPHQPLLARRHEHPFALGAPLEEELSLEHRRQGCRGDRQVGVEAGAGADDPGHDRGGRLREAPHERGAQRPSSDEGQGAAAPERGARGRAGAPALRAVADHGERLDVASFAAPERDLGGDAELDEEAQLHLAGDERRQLEQERARAGRAEEVEARRLPRLAACLRERRDRDLRIGRVELALGGERRDDRADVEARGEAVGGVGRACALVRRGRDALRRLEVRMDTGLRVREQRPVGALETRCAVVLRRHDQTRPTVGAGVTVARARQGSHQAPPPGDLPRVLTVHVPSFAPAERASDARRPESRVVGTATSLRFHICSPIPFPRAAAGVGVLHRLA
jgi:hypothetical protein